MRYTIHRLDSEASTHFRVEMREPTDWRLYGSRFVEVSLDMLALATVKGYYMTLNDRWSQTLGWSQDELKSRPYIEFVHPDDVMATLREAHALSQGVVTVSFENRYRHKNGSWVRLVWRAVYDHETELIFCTARDVTEQRRVEAEAEGRRLQLVVASQMASIGDLAASMAHEINNPLNVIHGWTDRMIELCRHETIDRTQFSTALSKVSAMCSRITNIMRGMRLFSQNADSQPVGPVALAGIVDDVMDFSRERFRLHDVALEAAGDATAVGRGRPAQIAQTIMNLLSNAFDAVLESPEPRWVRVTYGARADGRVEIVVTNSGPRIPADVAARMGEAYFSTKSNRGTGLGLRISMQLAEAVGGRLSYDRDAEHTSFRLELLADA